MEQQNSFLIIDDDPSNNMICVFVIPKLVKDANVKAFENPELALKYISEEYTDKRNATIIFLDINMPEMTGWEFIDEFKNFADEIRNQFTIYILSSSVDDRDKEKARTNSLVSGFLSKPLSYTRLVEILSAASNS